MVNVWVVPGIGSIDDEGIVRLNDGRTFDLTNVPGNGYNANRLGKINAAIQTEIDNRILLTSLPIDDPDRTMDPNSPMRYWSDSDGNPDPAGEYITDRSTLIWLTWDGTNLIPHCQTVR
jgi:hypothetical protein